MICKWCGERVEPSAQVCSHCGKELPPLSECGGFYHIMPEAKLAQVRAPMGAHIAEQPAPKPVQLPQEKPVEAAPAKDRNGGKLTVILAVILGLCLVTLIVALILLGQTKEKLRNAEALFPDRPIPAESTAAPRTSPADDPGAVTAEPSATTAPNGTSAATEPIPTESVLPTEPIVSELPTEPIETEEPTEPIVSELPTEPIETEEPTEPIVSELPTEPTETEEPTEPIVTEEPTEPPVLQDLTATELREIKRAFLMGGVELNFDFSDLTEKGEVALTIGNTPDSGFPLNDTTLGLLEKKTVCTWSLLEPEAYHSRFLNGDGTSEYNAVCLLTVRFPGFDDSNGQHIKLYLGRGQISEERYVLSANLILDNIFGAFQSSGGPLPAYSWWYTEKENSSDWALLSQPDPDNGEWIDNGGKPDNRDAGILMEQPQWFRLEIDRRNTGTGRLLIRLNDLSLEDFDPSSETDVPQIP